MSLWHTLRLAIALTIAVVTTLTCGCDNVRPLSPLYLASAIDTEGGAGADGVVSADIDGDGDLDAVSAWEGSDHVRLHLQLEGGIWANSTIAEGPSVAGVEDIAVGDIDGDGRADVVAACESGVLTWIRQGESWSDDVISASADVGCESWIDVEIADFNGDARLDLVAACKGGGWVSVFHAPEATVASETFVQFDIDTTDRIRASCVRVADLDQDDDLDIISAARGEQADSIVWYENPGPEDAFTSAWDKHPIGHWPDTIWLDIGDIDGDRRLDVAVSSWEYASFAWFRQPAQVRDLWQGFTVGQFDDTRGAGVTIADLESDGQVDLVVGTYRNGRLAVFRHLGSATGLWLPTTLAIPGGRLDLVPVLDIDGNGRLDILTTVDSDDGGVFWYRPWI